jgi:hypothetical protein
MKGSFQQMFWLLIWLTWPFGSAYGEQSEIIAKNIPPSWQQNRYSHPKPAATAKKRRRPRPWYQPRAAIGLGVGVPELVTLESFIVFGKFFGIRAFFTPPLPFKIRVNMPAEVISTKNDIGVANPPYTVRFSAIYGANHGADLLAFPFAGSFFVGLGVASRTFNLKGQAKSPILVCSLIEAVKEPPCNNPDARIETLSQLDLKAKAQSDSLLSRASLGFFWYVGRSTYLTLTLGALKPFKTHSHVKVDASIDAPGDLDQEIAEKMVDIKSDRETEMAKKAQEEIEKIDKKLLPMASLSFGFRF